MKDRTAARLAWLAFGFITVSFLAGNALSILFPAGAGGEDGSFNIGEALFSAAMFSFPVFGIVIASRQPRNTIAWIFLAIGLAWNMPLGEYAYYGLFVNPGSLPAADVAGALESGGWVPPIGLMGRFSSCCSPTAGFPLAGGSRWPGCRGSRSPSHIS